MIDLRAQTGPVLLTYRASPAVDRVVSRVTSQPPLFDFTAPDGVQHTIWRANADAVKALVDAFGAIPLLYIADGHHRAASAARARQQLGANGAHGEWDTVLAVAFPDDQMQVLPYNRVVKDLGSHTSAWISSAARAERRSSRSSSTPESSRSRSRCIR